ncbi:biofilm regulation phosphoprotein SiaC [Dechloromonas sp. ZY10]|uniref:biofilm regulation phosphoprotein SiaC n=1 Tax=Dechloromonas aquae TaxID=2664436 RepID=UPI0035299F0F
MENLQIDRTNSSPSIDADWDKGIIRMQGDSYPENSFELFQPLIDWVAAYLRQTDRPLKLELELLYLNTSSIRAMMDIFDIMEEAYRQGKSVAASWSYDAANERVGQLADEFKEDCSFPFAIQDKASS